MKSMYIVTQIKPRTTLKYDDVYEQISSKWEAKARSLRARREHKLKQQSRIAGWF